MKNVWLSEPTMILAVVQSIIALVISFGVGLTTEQVGAIMAASSAIIGLITRSRVVPK